MTIHFTNLVKPRHSVQGFRKPFEQFTQWLEARRTLAAIAELDDHLLADIGLNRDDVRWAETQPYAVSTEQELARRARRSRRVA